MADSSGHLVVKRSPINVAKRSSKGQKDTKKHKKTRSCKSFRKIEYGKLDKRKIKE